MKVPRYIGHMALRKTVQSMKFILFNCMIYWSTWKSNYSDMVLLVSICCLVLWFTVLINCKNRLFVYWFEALMFCICSRELYSQRNKIDRLFKCVDQSEYVPRTGGIPVPFPILVLLFAWLRSSVYREAVMSTRTVTKIFGISLISLTAMDS